MEDLIMKKQIYSILIALAVLSVSFPAYAGDWYATLEREILVNNNDEQAIENAVNSGVDRNTVIYAAYGIIEKAEQGLTDYCDNCKTLGCFDASRHTDACNALSCYGSYTACLEHHTD